MSNSEFSYVADESDFLFICLDEMLWSHVCFHRLSSPVLRYNT